MRPLQEVGAILQVEGLRAGYGSVQVLHDCSLQVNAGEIVALLGPNGAGKSTLFRAITGLLRPGRGCVRLFGQDTTRWPIQAIARMGVGIVPEGRQLFTDLSVRDNLLLAGYYAVRRRGSSLAEDLEQVFRLFPALRQRQDQAAGTLSGGQQQMVAIGRALMVRPRLLLLDEPSLGLAPMVVREIFDTVVSIRAQGVGVLIVEQNAAAALQAAQRAYVLDHGQIAAEGRADQLAQRPDLQDLYLGGGAAIEEQASRRGETVSR